MSATVRGVGRVEKALATNWVCRVGLCVCGMCLETKGRERWDSALFIAFVFP